MLLSTLMQRVLAVLKTLASRRRTAHSLSHLDAHLLKDIGLRMEQGVVRPLYPESMADDPEPAPARGSARVETGTAVREATERLCPSCGAPLT